MRTRLPCLAAIAAATGLCGPPAGAVEHDAGAWLAFAGSGALGSDGSSWLYVFDVQVRYLDAAGGITQYVVRPAVGYDLGAGRSGSIGYGRFETDGAGGARATENRWHQQYGWTAASWDGGDLTMRFRLEQRFVSVSDDMGLVLRYRARYAQRLAPDGTWDFVASVEPFVKLRDTDWSGDAGLAQNRLFLGVRRALDRRFAVEAGYMNQYVWLDARDDRDEHIAMIQLFARF